jgi:ketosteroid isomerase-like protein
MTVEEHKKNDEAEIKSVIESYVEALRAKDLDGIVSIYAPDLVAFDIVPPLQYVGADTFRKHWEEGFSSIQGPFGFEIADLDIAVGADVAFTHSLGRSSATLTTGQKIGNWLRWTACFRKIGGKWLIVHEHVSVPFDVATGRAVLDLKP